MGVQLGKYIKNCRQEKKVAVKTLAAATGISKSYLDYIEAGAREPQVDMLAKIVYVSDKIELGRKNDKYDIEYERELAKQDIDEAIIYIINSNIKQMIERGKIIHPKCLQTRNKLLINKINKKL